MSTAVVSTSAAEGRLFVFEEDSAPEVSCHPERVEIRAKGVFRGVEEPAVSLPKGPLPSLDVRLASVTPASRLEIRPAPEMASSGISALDALTGGLPRGCLTEICGPASSGRTTVLLAALAAATDRGEFCALVDASDALEPRSAADAGIDLDRLLWVRCGEGSTQRKISPQRHRVTEKIRKEEKGCPISRASFAREVGIPLNSFPNSDSQNSRAHEHSLEQLLRTTDLLLESGGFGMIVLDLADVPLQSTRRIPMTTWFRFRRAVEYKPTILLAIEQQTIAGSCSSLLLRLGVPSTQYPVPSPNLSHAQLLTELQIHAELIRSRHDRKPACSIAFETKTAWAG